MPKLLQMPELFVYKQDRKTCYGVVRDVLEFTEDIRFNSCSEINFTVPEEYYDIRSESWQKSQIYNELERDRLIYVSDDSDYFEYPVRDIGDTNFYKYGTIAQRDRSILRYNQNASLQNFTVQPEVEIVDVGNTGGYSFKHFARILYDGLQDLSFYHWSEGAAAYNPMLACDVYFPVKPTDVIAIRNAGSYLTPVTNAAVHWRVVAYTENRADAYAGEWAIDSSTASGWQKDGKGDVRINVAECLPNGGYVRFWYECDPSTCSYSYNSSEGGTCNWWYPLQGYAKIYSGDRRCTYIANSNTTGRVKNKMRWFVITDLSEENDGIKNVKKVTALSYEYTLHNTTFSLTGETLPLYIPPAITQLITGKNWVRDSVRGFKTTDYNTIYTFKSPQALSQGILNQLLEYLPGWSIKYVSSNLMTTYRNLEDVDDINIYSYLMNTLQSKYNCFFVYDNDNKTISAYTQEDLAALQNPIHLTWDNAIKHFEKSNVDSTYFTALRVKAGDSEYGIGLVNPTGNGMIYNFSRIKKDLKYIPADSNTSAPRTLYDAVVEWESAYAEQLQANSEYQTTCKNWADAHMKSVQAKTDAELALQDYHVKADEINVWLRDDLKYNQISPADYSVFFIREVPKKVDEILNGRQGTTSQVKASEQFHDTSLQGELASLADAYAKAVSRYDAAETSRQSNEATLRRIAQNLTMNYDLALRLNNGNPDAHGRSTTILSANEIKELGKYIVEGTWIYEDASFSETYSADDIYSMLKSIFDEARSDLAERLSIANYDFSIDSTNIIAVPDFHAKAARLFLGHLTHLHVSKDEYVKPMLLEIHLNYKDETDFSFTFTTDMKRKPIKMRFADLFNTITQTSVTDNAFTFDE